MNKDGEWKKRGDGDLWKRKNNRVWEAVPK